MIRLARVIVASGQSAQRARRRVAPSWGVSRVWLRHRGEGGGTAPFSSHGVPAPPAAWGKRNTAARRSKLPS